MDLSGYTLATLHQDGEFALCRGRTTTNPTPHPSTVLVSMPTAEHPPPNWVRMLEHELAFRAELDSRWALRPLALTQHQGRPALIFEDQQGESLARLLDEFTTSHDLSGGRSAEPAIELGLFLRLGVGLAGALREVHRRGIVHKNVKPAHVLVNAATGQVWLTGFGIASRLPRERQAPTPPETIAGTLAYMAPEQTGRMNRSVDGRSDLYALGVTLYQMLTGSLPFIATEPIEWVHCHIARQPMPLGERVADVPAPVSAIVMKLLAKTSDERYQTAAGLERDLRRCLVQWEAERRVDDFRLGEHDIPDRLLIPEKLYGRAREIDTLLAAFDRIVQGGSVELVLVSGYPGIGKSSVVNELQPVLVPPRGLFAAGKFDQYKRDIPYATLAQAFRHLVRSLLAKSDVELGHWREALREALGANGQLVVDLVPDLRLIIGEQPPLPELPPQDAQRRFQLVFRRFLSVFATHEHPLALFLDDLQWLDAATLDLLEYLLIQSDVQHLLLVGAYRDNEITSNHPLSHTLDAIRKAGALIHDIVLAPLAREDAAQLITDSLHCDLERTAPLAELVYEKTAGNPFFLIQFLTALVDEGLLSFDHSTAGWSWDLARIRAKEYTDNVADLMVGRLSRLPESTQEILRRLACLGTSADFALLAMVYEDSHEKLRHDLQEALRSELVLVSDDSYRFLHDRVQEAAYSLIPESQRAEAHLRIGRLLVKHTPPERREEAIFEIVNQLNRSAALLTSRDEKEQLAEFNLIAGKRAKTSTAYLSALQYLVAGTSLLADDGGERRPDLKFALELHRAECEFLTGERGAAEARLTMLASRAERPLDQAAVAGLQIELYTGLDQNARAVDVCLVCLHRLGVELSAHPTEEEARREYERVGSLLGSREVEELLDLPWTSESQSVAILDVLTRVLTAAFYTDPHLTALLSCLVVTLSLEHGHTDASCFGYVCLGMISGPRFGDYKRGFRFGRLGYELVERHGLVRFRGRISSLFASVIIPWTRHLRTVTELTRRAFHAAHAVGDSRWAAYCGGDLIANRLAIGDPLGDVQRDAEQGLEFARKAGFGVMIDIITTQLALIRTLRGLTRAFGRFDHSGLDELSFERHLASGAAVPVTECWYWIRKMQARFVAGDYGSAVEASLNAQRLLWTSSSFFESAEASFYGALSRAACCSVGCPDREREHHEALTAHHKLLVRWAENCPENFEHRCALVGAEIARIDGCELDAERLYEAAIRSARKNNVVHIEALANELAARFYASRGFATIADAYLRNARNGYMRWGAGGKVRQLDHIYSHLNTDDAATVPTATIDASLEQLELATVIKVSQAVSGEMVLEKLLNTLMRTAIEHAGAERAVLMLSHGAEQRIVADATTEHDKVLVQLSDEPVSGAMLPESVLRYVLHTQESVVLDDAASANPFTADSYIGQRHARSLLCVPLMNRAKLIGVLYLENNLAPGVFAPARIAVLKLLASQAAISLDSARLYRDLGERERESRMIVDSVPGLVATLTPTGDIEAVNEQVLAYCGRTLEELKQWATSDTVHPDDLPSATAIISESMKSGAPYEIVERIRRFDGAYRWFQVRGLPLRGSNEGIVRWYILLTDIDDLKRAEHALAGSERNLKFTIDTIPALAWSARLDGSAEFFNRHYLDFVGLSAEQASGWGWMAAVHPEDLDLLASMWQRIMTSQMGGEAEARLRRQDGSYRWFLFRANPLRDEHGTIVKWYGINTDIEDRKQAETELRLAYDSFAEAQGLSHTGSFITDLVGDDHNWSEEAFRIFDFEPGSKVSVQRIRDIIHADDLPSFESVIARGMQGENVTFAFRIATATGAVKHVRGVAHVVEHVAGRPLFVGALQDVTESKVAEEALDRARSELARVARVTTVSAFTASIAHEVNQPLSGIVTNAGTCLRMLAADPPDVDGARETAKRTLRDGNRASDVITRLRALFSKREFTLEPLDINEITQEVVALSLSELQRNRMVLRSEFGADLPPITGDRIQLQQVILNLLRNASDAMLSVHDGPRHLLIATEREADDRVRLTVRDVGVGLDPQSMDKLFDAFFTTKTDGMGIGLSVSRSIIERHHGRLWAEPNDGPGTTFAFVVPAAGEAVARAIDTKV